jgi:multiple sugar transport system permease protein
MALGDARAGQRPVRSVSSGVARVRPVGLRVPRRSQIARHVALLGFGFLIAFPFIWMLLTSFKPFEETLSSPPTILPVQWRPENYAEAWRRSRLT